MDDLLMRSALAYEELVTFHYDLVIGKKEKLRHIRIQFPEVAYHHLAGFHKVGIAALSNKKAALRAVLAQHATYAQFTRAGATLEDRWGGICRLKEIIESNRTVFHYRGHGQPGSMIQGDYLMTYEDIAFFIVNETPASIFTQTNRRYEQGCPRFTTLQILREEITTGRIVCLYRASSYKPLV